MQPEEEASDCDKPNTPRNRIFHLRRSDKRKQQQRVAHIWRRWFQRTTRRRSWMPSPLAEFLHKYAVKRCDVLLLPGNMLWARVGSVSRQVPELPKGDCLDITSQPVLLDSLTFNLVNPLPGEYKFNFNHRSFFFLYLPCVQPSHPAFPPHTPHISLPISLSSRASLSIEWNNQVETIYLYWEYTSCKNKMNCYYMCEKRRYVCVRARVCVQEGGLTLAPFVSFIHLSAPTALFWEKKTLLFCHQWRQMLVISCSPFPAFKWRSHLQWKLILPLNTL